MKLQEHPKIEWPPGMHPHGGWTGSGRISPDLATIVLRKAELSIEPNRLKLTGEYNGDVWTSLFTLDDAVLIHNLCETLNKCRGQPIAEVGTCEVDQDLRTA
jgi:hypothetical protein